jgi:ubiquinone/menaquinone biosynthesis C-methylase UbiE
MPHGRQSRVLDVGCGTSKLLVDMRAGGHTGELVGIDISGIDVVRALSAAIWAAHYL